MLASFGYAVNRRLHLWQSPLVAVPSLSGNTPFTARPVAEMFG